MILGCSAISACRQRSAFEFAEEQIGVLRHDHAGEDAEAQNCGATCWVSFTRLPLVFAITPCAVK